MGMPLHFQLSVEQRTKVSVFSAGWSEDDLALNLKWYSEPLSHSAIKHESKNEWILCAQKLLLHLIGNPWIPSENYTFISIKGGIPDRLKLPISLSGVSVDR